MNHDTEPIFDYKNGRWLCSDHSMAVDCAYLHPGEYVYTYERDHEGKMIHITLAHDPHANTPLPVIKAGKIQGVKPSEFEE